MQICSSSTSIDAINWVCELPRNQLKCCRDTLPRKPSESKRRKRNRGGVNLCVALMSHRSSWIIWNQKSSLKPSPMFGLWSAFGSDFNSSVNIQKARGSQGHNWHDIYFVVLRCFIIDSNFWRIEDRSTALLVVSSVESCLVTQAFLKQTPKAVLEAQTDKVY